MPPCDRMTPCAGVSFGNPDLRGNRVALVLDVDEAVLVEPAHAVGENLRIPANQDRPSRHVGVEALGAAIVHGQYIVSRSFYDPKALQVVEFIRHLFREIVCLRPIFIRVVQLPHVIVKGGRRPGNDPRRTVTGDRRPALVVDTAVSEHLKVLRFTPLRCPGMVKTIAMLTPCIGTCADAIDHVWLGIPAASRMVGATSMT